MFSKQSYGGTLNSLNMSLNMSVSYLLSKEVLAYATILGENRYLRSVVTGKGEGEILYFQVTSSDLDQPERDQNALFLESLICRTSLRGQSSEGSPGSTTSVESCYQEPEGAWCVCGGLRTLQQILSDSGAQLFCPAGQMGSAGSSTGWICPVVQGRCNRAPSNYVGKGDVAHP